MDRQHHWNAVYTAKGEQDVSWFEALPAVSPKMIEAAGLTTDTCVLGPTFTLVQSVPHVHHTPWGSTQSFQYSRFAKQQ